MIVPDIIEIDLDASPAKRWEFARSYSNEINELVVCYWKEIDEYAELIQEYIGLYKSLYIPQAYQEEIRCLAQYCKFTEDQLLIVNLYYDIIKIGFACTAFAFEQSDSIWHARNLDWWTENDLLAKYTKVFHWKKGGKTVFKSVGWMGFIGVLSGMKPHQFSITLNAVLSEEAPNFAKPISFLLREVLEDNHTYQSAKEKLETTPIVCDCLLLLAGTKAGEIAVIERTPTKSQTRYANQQHIVVTNDYKTAIVNDNHRQNILTDTSCMRYDKAKALLLQQFPNDEAACFQILDDEAVKMTITVQQMVFNADKDLVFTKEPSM